MYKFMRKKLPQQS